MQPVVEQITRINLKLQELLKKYAACLKEVEQQQKTIAGLRQQQELNEQQIKALREQQFILKASAGKMDEGDKKQFDLAINKYIREIDQCIDLLSE